MFNPTRLPARAGGHCLLLALLLFLAPVLRAQQAHEAAQELSKAAKKGMLVNVDKTPDGNLCLTYMMKVAKKSDQLSFEDYLFDKELNYKGVQPSRMAKIEKPDDRITLLGAYVGGGNSFNVLSTNLWLQREEWQRTWDYARQKYHLTKRLSKETVKPRNNGSKYRGFADFRNEDDGSEFVIASYDQGKDEDDQFVCLYVTPDLEMKEARVPVNGEYSLVYCGELQSGNKFLVLAPNKGAIDTRKYVYAEFTNKADLVHSTEFTAPSPNMAIMDHRELDGSLYFVAASTDKNEAYNQVFTSYAPIVNPGFPTSANRQMEKYEKKMYGEEFDNFHFLKFTGGNLTFASTTLVKNLKDQVKTPPSQKKEHPYKGRKMTIETLAIAPNGNFLLAGQLMDRDMVKGERMMKYLDLVGFLFNPKGELITQWAVEKMNDDTKSELFPCRQNFLFSPDGKSAYWEVLEVKGTKGYANWADALNGNLTFMANYFPRVTRVSLSDGVIEDFKVMGDKGKYLIYPEGSVLAEPDARYYIGHDDDYEKVWVGKYEMQ